MARTNQTFKAALKLNAEQFKKEAANVKRTLGTLKSSFMGFAGALGAGLGFTQLIGTMRKTALELSTARATLENVSKETKIYSDGVHTAAVETSNYAENLRFVSGLAKKYKQDIVTLTDSFAKFSAAASTANVNMATQRDVFESLARAATFFHMSGDRTQQMMVAIEQMFSKGKVTSEELRRQLGNNLPGAFGLMAQAIGVSNAELDKMMKNGEVLAADALPKFAKELDKVTKSLNTDSLQLAQNELRNAWVGLVDSSGFENAYKKILQLTTRFLNQLKTSFNTMIGLIGGIFGGSALTKSFNKGLQEWDKYTKGVQKNIDKLEKDFGKASGEFKQKYGLDPVTNRNQIRYVGKQKGATEMYNDYLKVVDVQKQIHAEQQKINGVTGKWHKAINGIGFALKGVATTLKSALASFGFTAAIAAIGAIIGGIVDLVKRLNQAKNAVNELNKEFDKLSDENVKTPVQIEAEGWVKDLEKLSSEGKQNTKEWGQYIGEINKLMGSIGDGALTVADNMDTIKKKVGEWLDLTKKVRQYNFAVDEESRAESTLFDLRARRKEISEKGFAPAIRVAVIDKEIKAEEARLARAKELQQTYKLTAEEIAKMNGGSGDTGGTESDLSKVIKKQKNALKELENQFKAGALTEKEYNDELADLIEKTFKAITAFDNFEAQLQSLGQSGWFEDIARQFALLKLAIDEEADALAYDAEMAKRAADAYERFKDNQTEPYKYQKVPERGFRNQTFDYKKSKSDILGEEIDLTKEQVDVLTDAVEKAREEAKKGITEAAIDLAGLQKQLKEAQGQLTDLNDKMVLAQLQEDISKYEEQMFTNITSGIKNTATAMDRLVTSTKNLFETMNNPDATAWEQIMAVFNQIIQIFDTITGMIEMFNKLSEISNMLAGAKEILNAKQLNQKEAEIGLVGTLAAEEAAEGATAVEAAAAKAIANKANAVALTEAAFASGAGNAMAVPYPANLAALASNQAAIAQMIAAGKAIAAFKDGGFVKGGSGTDNTLIRATPGELVLNKGQQTTLFNLLNGKGGLGGKVDFEIRGDRLWGTLQNYNQKKRG